MISNALRSFRAGWKRSRLGFLSGFGSFLLLAAPMGVASAETAQLAPQTRLRVSVVQWMPLKGEYQTWNALGGEFVVSDKNTITLPVVGDVAVGDKTLTALADELATLIQTRTGLAEKPNTTVEVVRYPPVYVVGKVNKPGEYEFRPGLTVLQALALGGGEITAPPAGLNDQTELVGGLRATENEILRSRARIVRLEAEMADARSFSPPEGWAAQADKVLAQQIVAQEKIIFDARRNEVERQGKRLADLRDLLNAEIGVLRKKIGASDDTIASAERELKNVTTLVQKGVATASRQSELERLVADRRADRLDQITAVMRAQQSLTETNRSLDGLADKRRTDVASELQSEQAKLEQAILRRDTAQKLILEAIASGRVSASVQNATLRYELVRRENGEAKTRDVSETESLEPGDVLKVGVELSTGAEAVSAASPSSAALAMEASQ
ncbi:polysaccharide biosynthesis/export family protein [Mesorhizobium sp. RP14(2022)]|uniref:Polysaccharide biosynthesis/export family protein n=1 Tax=Mesorhizobium liriopis TaxID=2953882 RepID=A0ABT1C2Q6_9HYPH|nr:polysaccharide biosynthesis/export family protein [Mesorhizobium liriopis]MCO6049110.1 polysaccharide biosynthesis/export family protein [Mesorhizobium liriopis]